MKKIVGQVPKSLQYEKFIWYAFSQELYDALCEITRVCTSSQADLSSMLRDADDSRTVNDVLNEMMTRVFPELTGIQPELLFTVSNDRYVTWVTVT